MASPEGFALAAAALVVVVGVGTSAGCDGDNESTASTSTSTLATTSASSGAGGAGGSGSEGGGGQGGSSASPCLDPSAYASAFTIADAELCAVAVYTADKVIATSESSPTWGSHGGLLTVAKNANGQDFDLTRWTAPSSATGKLTAKTSTLVTMLGGMWFIGAQAIDLPFFGWTAVSWTPAFPETKGELILAKGDVIEHRYAVNSYFSGAGLGAAASGRIVHSGLSAIEASADMNGLYAADSCGTDAQDPRLVPKADASCSAPSAISLWGESSGPVAVDSAGNVFAVMSNFSTSDQEARGFEASTIARGKPATAGATLFKIPGFGTSLAALAPDAKTMGLLAFQPADSTSFDALDVIEQRYSVSAGAVKAEGNTSVLLKLTTAGTLLTMTSDDKNRLWVAGTDGASGTLIVVIARAPN